MMSVRSSAPPKRPIASRTTKKNGIPPGILVDHQIRWARAHKLLDIDPFDDKFLEPATYDLRVGDRAAVTTASRPIDLRETEMLTLEPGAMAILQSLEVLSLSKHIVGRIGPKSSLLRRGVMAATGPQVDPGFHGRLIVNLINLSPRTFVLRHQAPFLSIEFHYLSEAPDHAYSGEYQDRTGLTSEELEILFAYQGPTLAEIHRGFAEIRDNLRDIAGIRGEFPRIEAEMRKGFDTLRGAITTPVEAGGTSFRVDIEDLGAEEYRMVKTIPVTVRVEEGAFVASFFDANIHASGDTDQEAIDNLRSLVLDTYDSLAALPEPDLAPPARRQLTVLRKHITQ